MATLCLGDVDCSAPLVRDWLGEDWALLFSHPADFQDQGLERDRWLEILRDEFRALGVRPIACRRIGADADGSWVGELLCDHRLLRLQAAAAADDGVVDMAARNLRDEILRLPPRFVLIIDESLHRRGASARSPPVTARPGARAPKSAIGRRLEPRAAGGAADRCRSRR